MAEALKRTAVTRTTRLKARASPYHTSVTLYETADSEAGPSTIVTKRTTRAKFAANAKTEESEPDSVLLETTQSNVVAKAKPSKAKKAKAIPQALAKPHPAPPRWRETYALLEEMRKGIVAPVDTMGCDQAQYAESDTKASRFSTLVSLMLSSQTKDEVTNAAVAKLRETLGGSLCVANVMNAEKSTIESAINKVGFWRRKAGYIKNTADILHRDYADDIPQNVDDLCSLPGVGPKMAFLALQVAWNINTGIGVDTHVHRITNRLGWHKPPTKEAEQTRLNLQSWLPKDLHPKINHLLVGFGQVVCLPVAPRCDQCTLPAKGLCPSARTVTNVDKRAPSRSPKKGGGATVEIELEGLETKGLVKMEIDGEEVGGTEAGERGDGRGEWCP